MLESKLEHLKAILKETDGCAIAYSGGVDSSFLITVAHEVLKDRCLAVTATSSTYPKREYLEAVRLAQAGGFPFVTIVSEELDVPEFKENNKDRCYYCKRELFTRIRQVADRHNLPCVADGNNADDVRDYRPGLRAAGELGVLSPLKEAGLTKEEIRQLSADYHLPTADKPAMACLTSRFPYGSQITVDKLGQIERIEEFLREQGFRVIRARHYEDTLRLELDPDEMAIFLRPEIRTACVQFIKNQGFTYVTLDLEGYRTGSMNEILNINRI